MRRPALRHLILFSCLSYFPLAPLPPCQVLADPNFVTSLKTYDKDNVKPAIIDRIRKEYTCNADFNPANAAKASSAAEVCVVFGG